MALPPLRGHAEVRASLARAALSGVLPQSILLHGPAGVGKERLGLWLAQFLLCENRAAGEPCGRCLPCRLVERLEHPDLHWFFPLPRPDASSPEKLREKLEELRAAELAARRADPFHLPQYERAPAHFLAAVQTLQQLAATRPAMGSRKVFVVGDAEAMVPQESSPEAANAFLKLLEEPPEHTTLILTAQHPGSLLPTILSRVLPVRVRPLPREELATFLVEARGVNGEDAARVAALAHGALGRALRLLPAAGEPGAQEKHRHEGRRLLEAALSDGATGRLAAAHALPPAGARGDFLDLLDALTGWLRDLLAVASGVPDQVVNSDGAEMLSHAARKRSVAPLAVAAALERLPTARELAFGNVNPQLILAELLRGVSADLAA
ncbi:MAG TPA: hypothetical protein VGR27_15925 [Longimicrobiaceae bacterium]|nr:hypothetical protein [Longimicrobiaceae bacterium]